MTTDTTDQCSICLSNSDSCTCSKTTSFVINKPDGNLVIAANNHPLPIEFNFTNGAGKKVGHLFYNSEGKLEFEGDDVDESAKQFFEKVILCSRTTRI